VDPLPIDEVLPAVVSALRAGAAAVLTAPPGAGKTTRVPPALLAAGVAGAGRVVVLEPRRIAARAAARRIAAEQGWRVGEEVGYQVRFERRAGPATRILVVTEGILVQMLQSDPFLDGVGAVVFDELHERSLATDLSLAMARRVQREARPDLRLMAMSATLDTAAVADFLGHCPVVESRGRLHAVELRYLEPGRGLTAPAMPTPLQGLMPLIATAARQALAESAGDVLVFLPGRGEIQRAADALSPLAAEHDLALVPLYGDLPAERQDEALRPASRRKVVLATNVAETSVTVEGIGAVVDSGLARRLRYDPASGLDRLELARISRAAAEQRAGRAGRQGPGICWRLWSSWEQASRPEREVPEIARVDLAAPVLQLLAWGESDLSAFGWLEAPDPPALAAAMLLLRRLQAVDGHGVTPDGRIMARLPVHPRLARLLLAGHRRGQPRDAALLAALLAERDPFPRRSAEVPRTSRSDLLDRLDDLERFARPGAERGAGEADLHRSQRSRVHFVLRARDQLVELARRELGATPRPAASAGSGTARGGRDDVLLEALLAAYPDRLARRREAGSQRAVMVGGRGVRLAETSAVREAELFVAVEIDSGRGGPEGPGSVRGAGPQAEDRVRLASAVEPAWLDAARLSTEVELAFDERRERVAAWRRTRWEDLVIAESELPAPAGGAAESQLAAVAARHPARARARDDPEIAGWLARVRCLAEWMPELGLPDLRALGADEEVAAENAAGLETALRQVLAGLAAGRRSFAELRRAPLLPALQELLTPRQLAALDREAPERLAVPSGSRIRLRYEPGQPPVLAARIQELFGLAETPRVAGGRIAVLLHLLAPNQRPQQVTQDLRSFWQTTYPQVKKELQGRYPRHSWPDDPWNACPEKRPGRRRTPR
jgi:ATP-dependent helicase HrpB